MSLGRHVTIGFLSTLALGCVIARPDVPSVDGGGKSVSVSGTGGRVAASGAPTGSPTPGSAIRPAGATPTPGAAISPADGTAATATPGAASPGDASPTPVGTATATATPGAQATATPKPNPFGMPRPLALPLPPALAAMGFAPLISDKGGSLLANNGAGLVPLTKLITDNGAGVISNNGGSYRLAQATPTPAASAPLFANNLAGTLAATLQKGYITTLIAQAVAGNSLLTAAVASGMAPDVPRTYPYVDGSTVTAMITVKPTHATLSIYHGDKPDPATRFVTISYTKPTRVRVVLLTDRKQPTDGRSRWVEEYDLETGQLACEGVFEQPPGADGKSEVLVGRWELSPPGPGEPAGTAYTFRNPSLKRKPNDPDSPIRAIFATNFLADGYGATWYKSATGTKPLQLYPADSISFGKAPPAPYDVYMTPAGLNHPAAEASAALKAILPAIDARVPDFPPDPADGDPFARPELAFLD